MASTLSVSKGVFVFNQKKIVRRKQSTKYADVVLYSDPWYSAYKNTWKWVEGNFEELRHKTFSSVLHNLASFVKNTYDGDLQNDLSVIPTAALLTGINMPDHGALFSTLSELLQEEVSPHVAVLDAHKCKTIRHTIEQMTSQFMNSVLDEDIDSDDSQEEKIVKVKKSQSNMLVLQSWYYEHYQPFIVTCDHKESKKRKSIDSGDEAIGSSPINDYTPAKIPKREICSNSEQENEFPRKSPRKINHRIKIEDGEISNSSKKIDKKITSPLQSPTRKALGFCSEINSPDKSLSEVKINSLTKDEHSKFKVKSRKSLNFSDETSQEDNPPFEKVVVKNKAERYRIPENILEIITSSDNTDDSKEIFSISKNKFTNPSNKQRNNCKSPSKTPNKAKLPTEVQDNSGRLLQYLQNDGMKENESSSDQNRSTSKTKIGNKELGTPIKENALKQILVTDDSRHPKKTPKKALISKDLIKPSELDQNHPRSLSEEDRINEILAEDGRPKRTPKKISRLIDELEDSNQVHSSNRKKHSNEKQDKVMTELRRNPKIISNLQSCDISNDESKVVSPSIYNMENVLVREESSSRTLRNTPKQGSRKNSENEDGSIISNHKKNGKIAAEENGRPRRALRRPSKLIDCDMNQKINTPSKSQKDKILRKQSGSRISRKLDSNSESDESSSCIFDKNKKIVDPDENGRPKRTLRTPSKLMNYEIDMKLNTTSRNKMVRKDTISTKQISYKLDTSEESNDEENLNTLKKQTAKTKQKVWLRRSFRTPSKLINYNESSEENKETPTRHKRMEEVLAEENGRPKRTLRRISRLLEEEKLNSPKTGNESIKVSCASPQGSSKSKAGNTVSKTPDKQTSSVHISSRSSRQRANPKKSILNIDTSSDEGENESNDEMVIAQPRQRRLSEISVGDSGKPKRNTRKVARLIKDSSSSDELDEKNVHCQSNHSISSLGDRKEPNEITPKSILNTINKYGDFSVTKGTQKWVCEFSKVSPSTPLRIPKIVLRQIDKIVSLNDPIKLTATNTFKLQQSDNEKLNSSRHSVQITSSKSTTRKSNNIKFYSSDNKYLALTKENITQKRLIVVIPEFEKFSSNVLQDFILLLRSSIPTLPFVLIMGIATSVAAVHRSLPYRMSACLSIKVFQSPPSVRLLNYVLEEILFSSACPFWLGSRTFSFLMDVFLCYDLSVKGFVQAFKFCMMEHFCGQDWKILCCTPDLLNDTKRQLTAKDIAALRDLPSFTRYLSSLEDENEKKKLQTDEAYMKKIAVQLLKQFHETMDVFHVSLKCLNLLVHDLPQTPLGSQVRELYGIGVSTHLNRTPEYKECFKLLNFLSREELVSKLEKMLILIDEKKDIHLLCSFSDKLKEYKMKVQEACVKAVSVQQSPSKNVIPGGKMNRYAFKEKLYEISKKDKYTSPFEKARGELIDYLCTDIFPRLLKPPATLPLAEVVMFDDLYSVRAHIVGAPRAAIHTALTNPQAYLECECCVQTEKDAIIATMPDICIAYKLYRECGRMINLYDWLQAFSSVIKPQKNKEVDDEDDKPNEVDPIVQARFTRAVAELQFMGFLKTSGRKIDHVTKLCFDGGF